MLIATGLATILVSHRSMLAQNRVDAGWSLTGNLVTGRSGHTATLLQNGKVLVAGGFLSNNTVLNSSELYDPVSGTWTPTGDMDGGRTYHTATLLQNGHVLIAGGQTRLGGPGITWTGLYNPATGSWSSTNNRITDGRYGHSATLLSNGKVLITGGIGTAAGLASAEIYDPTTFLWSAMGSLTVARGGQSATLLQNGKVLAIDGSYMSSFAAAELYDPSTGNWVPTNSFFLPGGSRTATLLPNGKVLFAGGRGTNTEVSSASLYDPLTGTWTPTSSMSTARDQHSATVLPNGKVLIVGGINGINILDSAEIYDPASGTWSATGNLAVGRGRHPAVSLANGRVLVVGGEGGPITNTSELYEPASAFSVAGRILTPTGNAVRNTVVALTDANGFRRTATTSSFGSYIFTDLNAGPYTITVGSKRYRFAAIQMQINANAVDVNLAGLE